jgi:hypothetical protein
MWVVLLKNFLESGHMEDPERCGECNTEVGLDEIVYGDVNYTELVQWLGFLLKILYLRNLIAECW